MPNFHSLATASALVLAAVLAAVLLVSGSPRPAEAGGTTFVVSKQTAIGGTNAGNSLNDDGFCNLREAVNVARTNSLAQVPDDCGLVAGTTELDTITFEADPGTLVFELDSGIGPDVGDLNFAGGPVLIEKTGAGFVSISGGDVTNILQIDGDELSVRNITLTHGVATDSCGGGALNGNGDILFDNVTMLGNNSTSMVGAASTICAGGDLTITGSSIFNNFAAADGKLMTFSGGTLEITNTLISENAPGTHSGVWIFDPGAGTGVANITNSTIAATDGGILVHASGASTVNLLNSTIKGTGSAPLVETSGTSVVNAKNTIFSSDSGCGDLVTDNGNNLDTGNGCGLSGANDSLVNADPMLGPITGLPGWGTSLYPLEEGSEAIDAGTNTGCPATDQRGTGFPRPLDGDNDGTATCDIGAHEADVGTNPSPTPGPTASPTPTPAPTDTPAPTPTETAGPTGTATQTVVGTPVTTPTGSATVTPTVTVTATSTPIGSPTTTTLLWGDLDCNGSVAIRDNQALLRNVLSQNPLSQTEPCPDIGSSVTIGGVTRSWGDLDCSGAIAIRDNQALLRDVLSQNPLSQTEPCPDIGSQVTITD